MPMPAPKFNLAEFLDAYSNSPGNVFAEMLDAMTVAEAKCMAELESLAKSAAGCARAIRECLLMSGEG